MNPDLVVQHIGMGSDGSLEVQYCRLTEDAKENGLLHLHTLVIPAGSDYDDEIRAVLEAVQELIEDAVDDLPRMGPPADLLSPATSPSPAIGHEEG